MERIVLKKKERYFLREKFYIIVEGSVNVYEIFENGKYLPKEIAFKKGEIVGNFFQTFQTKNLLLPESEVEIVAIEDNTIIEEFNFQSKFSDVNIELNQVIIQLLKENIFKLFYHFYDKKGYFLAILKFSADEEGKIPKEKLHYENFLMSKSQFYNVYNNLKNEKYIFETGKNVELNMKKIEEYFLEIHSQK